MEFYTILKFVCVYNKQFYPFKRFFLLNPPHPNLLKTMQRMKRTFPIFLLYIVCGLLSACQEETCPDDADTAQSVYQLSVALADYATGSSTRAADQGHASAFQSGDMVGLTVCDALGNLLADNLPFCYDGTTWSFDTSNSEGKSLPYYDPDSYRYLVYYPYHADADGATTVEQLKALPVFQPQADQSTAQDFRYADLLAWSRSGTASRKVHAELSHVRTCFSLEPPEVSCTLGNGQVTSYGSTLWSDIRLSDTGGNPLKGYLAADNTYRYILPEGFCSTLRFFYDYSGATYAGDTETLQGDRPNVRYVQQNRIDIGTFSYEQMRVKDIYCTSNGEGFVLPQELADQAASYGCIGVIYYIGRYTQDYCDYSVPLQAGGPCLPDNVVHGYVIALTDAYQGVQWGPTDVQLGNDPNWLGYTNCQNAHGQDINDFPAFYRCENFGYNDDWQSSFVAPTRSSGWFLPSYSQMREVYNVLPSGDSLYPQIQGSYPDDHPAKAQIFNCKGSSSTNIWLSSEASKSKAYYANQSNYGDYSSKSDTRNVRATLVF